MIKKLFWYIVLFSTLFGLIIFKIPSAPLFIEENLKIEWFNNSVINFKNTYNNLFTKIPSKEKAIETYNHSVSWAIYFKDKFVEWLDITKWKIDNIRNTLSWVKDSYDSTIDIINTASGKINDTIKVVNKIKNVFWTWANTTVNFINSASGKINDTVNEIKDVISTWSTN